MLFYLHKLITFQFFYLNLNFAKNKKCNNNNFQVNIVNTFRTKFSL